MRIPACALIGMFVLLLAGCSEEPRDRWHTLYVFGTLLEIVIPEQHQDGAEKALPVLADEFNRMHRDWHAWKPGELSRLNAAFAAGEGRAVSPSLLAAIKQGREFERLSGGLFNPAIGKIVAAVGLP